MLKVGYVGLGNMGQIVARVVDRGPKDVMHLLSDHNLQKAQVLSADLVKENRIASNQEVMSQADLLFLGLKPAMVARFLQEMKAYIKPSTVVISMAAGISLASLQSLVGAHQPVIRMMPNTPIAVGQGMITYVASPDLGLGQLFESLMQAGGQVLAIDEALMDQATAIFGCGPAYVYHLLEAFMQAGQAIGLPSDLSRQMVLATFAGATEMVKITGQAPLDLSDQVTSPGGSTIEGVKVMQALGAHAMIEKTIEAAYHKTVALGRAEKEGKL